ncbi:M24 family metallopeptidase [Pandoraea apista]|uniref:(Fe-S)-binding protein n=1 Tax=Pandoraea apista TaxID=93218 RepID=A0A5E5P8J8_9BURK|nr:M24 family metallopeptidase [Pandoraea apista]OXS94087.1 (Fe-S)-binding protein [Pandoraea apista]VVG72680.1 (Fe-S)-binding protein [Pandoraea apista]
MELAQREAVGAKFSAAAMQRAQALTWEAAEMIAAIVKPGMRESEAIAASKALLETLGMDRIWHPVLIRFGENTLRTFSERSDNDPVLGNDDIYFIDIGVVFGAHEGDCGFTRTTGTDPEMQRCADDVKRLFDIVHAHWRTQGVSGQALYAFAKAQAKAMGWVLNLDMKGHRVSDFPHAIYKAGKLADLTDTPSGGLWILEIQIAHPTRPFGAFYEDLLV